jgi:hypothetical protein
MRIALADLRLEQLVVLYPGSDAYSLDDRVSVVPLSRLAERGDSWIPKRRRSKLS